MSEPTNELRQACDRLRSSIYTDVQNVVSALLSRLDREAEASTIAARSSEFRLTADERRDFADGDDIQIDVAKITRHPIESAKKHHTVTDAGRVEVDTSALVYAHMDREAEAERLLKVAREAIEKAPHAINCEYLSPIHTVCGHPANSRKHAGACDADWIPPAELKQRDCNCWKSRVLAEIAPAAPQGEKP